MSVQHRLLVIDDEPKICALIERAARPVGFETQSLTDPSLFRETVAAFLPTLLVIDLKMPGHDGAELLQCMKDMGCEADVVVVSGMDPRVLNTAKKLGDAHGLRMLGVIQKPVDIPALQALLRGALSGCRKFEEAELDAAIAGSELVVHYQPKIARENGAWSIEGAEALVRWHHPAHGLIMPGEFLPLAEKTGLIRPLTDRVLECCMEQLSSWVERGIEVSIAVNISAHLIEDLAFPERLQRLLREHHAPSTRLILELTESAAMADPAKAMDIFLRLRLSDISLSIDDFGTGFSSLKQLYQLPFDELKIDRAFVQALPGDEEARAIVRAMVQMAHTLNMKVCAEGVETRGAFEYLESVGCDKMQGFLVSGAVSASEFEQLLGPWNSQALRRALSAGG